MKLINRSYETLRSVLLVFLLLTIAVGFISEKGVFDVDYLIEVPSELENVENEEVLLGNFLALYIRFHPQQLSSKATSFSLLAAKSMHRSAPKTPPPEHFI